MKKTRLYVKGMHCASCDILVRRKFMEEGNVTEVCPDYTKQTVDVTYTGTLDAQKLNSKISKYGYAVVTGQNKLRKAPYSTRLLEAAAIAVVLLIVYYFANEFKLTSWFQVSSGNLTYATAFLLGLVASTSTCMATSGALFMTTVGKLRKDARSVTENIIPAVSFNIGRVLSYAVFGFMVGLIGNTLISGLNLGIYMNIIIAVLMLGIGLDMLNLIPLSSVSNLSFAKKIYAYLEDRLVRSPRKTSFILGAITYLLPCGFTQSVQVYALGLANPVSSSLMMTSFALGTVPVLMLFGFTSSMLQSNIYKQIAKVVAVVIVLIGLNYVGNTLALYGITFKMPTIAQQTADPNVVVRDGYQVATMNAGVSGYYPNTFTVKQGVPVRWIVNGQNVYGCQGELVAPKIAVQKVLKVGENVIEFIPEEKGLIAFSCAMGMFQGRFNVI